MSSLDSIRWDAAAVVAVALGLGLLPATWRYRVQGAALDALGPAQAAIAATQQTCRQAAVRVTGDWPGRAAALEAQLAELRAERDALAAQLAVQWPDTRAATEAETSSLVQSQLIIARVLGRQAQASLAPADLLEIGLSSGVAPWALVTDVPVTDAPASDAPMVFDAGEGAGLAAGQLAFTGRRVLGRIGAVGLRTSTLKRVSDLGYRDLVAVAHLAEGALQVTATGVLEGAGDGLCRIRHVEVSRPVDVGDYILTAETEGLLPQPLFYGQIIRAERQPDSPHWELWMTPAAGPRPSQAAVLRATATPR
jgi:hypothetical protein